MPQFDGNESDPEYEAEHRNSRVAQGTNEMALQEGPSTSNHSQPPLVHVPPARESCNSRLSGCNQPTKKSYKSFGGHYSFARNIHSNKRPAKLAAKTMLKKVFEFFEEARKSSEDTSESEDHILSDYSEESAEESSDNVGEEEEDLEDEDFHSANSPTMMVEEATQKPFIKSQQSTKHNKKPLETFANESDCPSEDNKEPRKSPFNVRVDPDETKICHVESFDLELNSTRLDQFNIPATYFQAPEHYLRFLSK
jgi:hypothetical protein